MTNEKIEALFADRIKVLKANTNRTPQEDYELQSLVTISSYPEIANQIQRGLKLAKKSKKES